MISSSTHADLLAVLDKEAGVTTHWVSKMAAFDYCRFNRRARSAAIYHWMMELKALGQVTFLDDQKPVCWKITPDGSAALADYRARTRLTQNQSDPLK